MLAVIDGYGLKLLLALLGIHMVNFQDKSCYLFLKYLKISETISLAFLDVM